MRPYLVFTTFLLAGICLPSCIEISLLLTGVRPGTGGNQNDNDNSTNNNDNGSNGDSIPTVRLFASNPAPQLNEEVTLTCTILSGDETNVTFDFEPASARLIVDEDLGTASFIVSETEIGVSFTFTCTARNDYGTSPPSNSVLITPAAAP